MSNFQRALAMIVLPSVLAMTASAAKKPETNPKVEALIDVLFAAPEFEIAKLSPDGAYFAYLKEEGDLRILKTYNFKAKHTYQIAGASGVNHKDSSGFDQVIGDFEWLGPDQLLIYAHEGGVYYSGLWATSANLKKNEKLVVHDRVLFPEDPLPQNPTTALLRESERENYYAPLWCLDKESLKTYEAESNPGRVVKWQTDNAGIVRLAVVSEPNSKWSYLYRESEKAAWRHLPLPDRSTVVSFDVSGQGLLIAQPNADGRDELRTYDLSKNIVEEKSIGDPVYDVTPGVLRVPRTGTPLALYYDTDKPTYLWLSTKHAELSRAIQSALPGFVVTSIQSIEDGDFLFSAYSDTMPLAYFRYNVGKQEVRPLIISRPRAATLKWAQKTPITFAAKDGYKLHGYLTFPAGRAENQKVPLIVLSHGGPQARDSWGFDEEVQFLAALGYGVLQINYRGSSGFGLAHELSNTIEVAERSVDDVADGIRWAIDQGYANPKKVVVYGASYGGYISLAVATRYPELASAAVGFAGVYDWEEFLSDKSNPWLGSDVPLELFRWRSDYYLDVRKNRDRYRAVSPVNYVKQISCPVMLFHGSLDQRVSLAQTTAMAKALSAAGKSVEVVKDPDAIHGFIAAKQSTNFYRSLAAFLLKHVPPEGAQ